MIEHSFELVTNDPRHPVIAVSLLANVKPLPAFVGRIENADLAQGEQVGGFNVWPATHPRITVDRGERLGMSFRIRPREPQAGEISSEPAASGKLSCRLRRDANGSDYWLDVELGPLSEPGIQSIPVVLQVKDGSLSELTLTLRIKVLAENLTVTPQLLDLGDVSISGLRGGLRKIGRVGIRKAAGSLRIKGVSSTLPFLSVEAETIAEGSNYVIRVGVKVDGPLTSGSFTGSLHILTDDAERPRVEVPCKINLVE